VQAHWNESGMNDKKEETGCEKR